MTYTALWVIWIAAFFAIEIPALANKQEGDTLSEHVWQWFSMKGYGRYWRIRRFVLLGFLAWLSAHFLTGGKF